MFCLNDLQNLEFNDTVIFRIIVTFMCLEFFWETYLTIRQHRIYKRYSRLPDELIGVISPALFAKARFYSLHKSKYSMLNDAYSLICNVGFLYLNGLMVFWQLGKEALNYMGFEANEILQSAVFILLLNIVNTIVNLPFNIYYTFVLEESHGFNKQTYGFFIADKIKKHIFYQVLTVPLTCGVIYIVKIGGDFFFIYLWAFVMVTAMFLFTIYPDYIAPRFDRYVPLPDGELKTEIESLAESVGFPLYKIYIVEGSKRSAHSNAYLYGFFKNKRIVLFDTLLGFSVFDRTATEIKIRKKSDEKYRKGCTTWEVLAIIAHELGHWKLNHIAKNIVIAQVNLLLVFLVFGLLFRYQALYEAFQFRDSQPVIIGLIIVLHFVCLPYFYILNFCVAILSRRFEFEADNFAKKLGHSEHLKRALIKLNSDNLGFPIYDSWYSKWHHSHPPLLERIHALDKMD